MHCWRWTGRSFGLGKCTSAWQCSQSTAAASRGEQGVAAPATERVAPAPRRGPPARGRITHTGRSEPARPRSGGAGCRRHPSLPMWGRSLSSACADAVAYSSTQLCDDSAMSGLSTPFSHRSNLTEGSDYSEGLSRSNHPSAYAALPRRHVTRRRNEQVSSPSSYPTLSSLQAHGGQENPAGRRGHVRGLRFVERVRVGVPSVLRSLCLAPRPSGPGSEGRLLGWHRSSAGPSREALRASLRVLPVVCHGH